MAGAKRVKSTLGKEGGEEDEDEEENEEEYDDEEKHRGHTDRHRLLTVLSANV
jgi:hypothetical protein